MWLHDRPVISPSAREWLTFTDTYCGFTWTPSAEQKAVSMLRVKRELHRHPRLTARQACLLVKSERLQARSCACSRSIWSQQPDLMTPVTELEMASRSSEPTVFDRHRHHGHYEPTREPCRNRHHARATIVPICNHEFICMHGMSACHAHQTHNTRGFNFERRACSTS